MFTKIPIKEKIEALCDMSGVKHNVVRASSHDNTLLGRSIECGRYFCCHLWSSCNMRYEAS